MLGGLPYAPTELHNVTGQLTHNDMNNVLHQIVICHCRDLLLLDYHVASSQLIGTEDSLTAQSIQNAEVGDNFYFAISPALSDLTHFNYNLGSLKTNPPIYFRTVGVTEISIPPGVTAFIASLYGGGGGGGSGEEGGMEAFPKGGGGGGGAAQQILNKRINNPYGSGVGGAGAVLNITVGCGGDGGNPGDGKEGSETLISYLGSPPPLASAFGGFGGKMGSLNSNLEPSGGNGGNGYYGGGGGGGAVDTGTMFVGGKGGTGSCCNGGGGNGNDGNTIFGGNGGPLSTSGTGLGGKGGARPMGVGIDLSSFGGGGGGGQNGGGVGGDGAWTGASMSQTAGNGADGTGFYGSGGGGGGSGIGPDLQEPGKGGNGAQGQVIIQFNYSSTS